jgi:hypothetical protein
VLADVLEERSLVAPGDLVAAVAAQCLVVGHVAPDTSRSRQEGGKPEASNRQEGR